MKVKLPLMPNSQTLINHKECGAIVRRERSKIGMSLLDLADKINVSSPFLSDLERGNRNWTEARFAEAIDILNNAKTL